MFIPRYSPGGRAQSQEDENYHRLVDGTITMKEPETTRIRHRVDLPPSLALQLRQHRSDQEVNALLTGRILSEDDFVSCHSDVLT